jgi:hypothetical protein
MIRSDRRDDSKSSVALPSKFAMTRRETQTERRETKERSKFWRIREPPRTAAPRTGGNRPGTPGLTAQEITPDYGCHPVNPPYEPAIEGTSSRDENGSLTGKTSRS